MVKYVNILGLLVFCFFSSPGETAKKDANSTYEEVQLYPGLDEDYVLSEISTNISSPNSISTVFLDSSVQESGNATDEGDECSLISRIVAVFRTAPNFHASQENEGRSLISPNVTLKVKQYPSSNSHVFKPATEDAVVLKEKSALCYPTTLSIFIISFIYTFVSLLCALVCIISVPKFIVVFIASNFYTYFLLGALLRGSLCGSLIYLIPFHLNFLFLLVTGWLTLLSCKVVFKQLIARKILTVVSGGVVGSGSHIFQLHMSLSCLFALVTILGTPPYGMHSISYVVENVYPRLMAHLTPSVILLLLTVMGVDVVFTPMRKRTDDLGVRHTKCYMMFICYHLLATVTWMYGFLAVNLPAYPPFWHVYLFVTACLPFSLMQNVFLSTRVSILPHVARDAHTENIFRVRIENV